MPSYKKDDSVYKTEFWGICCESGKRYSQVVAKKFHISMAALDPTDTATSPCVSLMVERDGLQYLLCSLRPDSILQAVLDLYFEKGEDITFFLKGHGTVHMSGYYIIKAGSNNGTLQTSPSNRRVNQLSSLFAVSNHIESSEEESSEVEEVKVVEKEKTSPQKKAPTKPVQPKKRLQSKLISEEEEFSDDDESWEDAYSDELEDLENMDEEESEAEEEVDNEEENKKPANKRQHSAVDSEEDSGDDDSGSEGEAIQKEISKFKKQLQLKKLKTDKSSLTPNKKSGKKSMKSEANDARKPDMNSSIGKTPMPKSAKPSPSSAQSRLISSSQLKTPKKEAGTMSEEKKGLNSSMEKSPLKSENELNTSSQSASSKKKKKKSKAALENQEGGTPKGGTPQKKFSHKLQSGVEFEDIRIGNGLPAKKGKMVHVYYTGQLENNNVFDSCKAGSKPFSFKLASGQVIKGWNVGIEGMKAGGKRLLKIPPSMGYGKQGNDSIPPNSTLYFNVELKAVS